MSKQLTIRGVWPELGKRLEQLSAEREQSVNATVLELLAEAVGLDQRRERFRRYATWTKEDLEDVMSEVQAQRQVDEDLWR